MAASDLAAMPLRVPLAQPRTTGWDLGIHGCQATSLVSGLVMLALGLVMLLQPDWLL